MQTAQYNNIFAYGTITVDATNSVSNRWLVALVSRRPGIMDCACSLA